MILTPGAENGIGVGCCFRQRARVLVLQPRKFAASCGFNIASGAMPAAAGVIGIFFGTVTTCFRRCGVENCAVTTRRAGEFLSARVGFYSDNKPSFSDNLSNLLISLLFAQNYQRDLFKRLIFIAFLTGKPA